MSISSLSRDTVSLLKKSNGEEVKGIKANVQKKKIFIQRSDVLIEPGDLIQRKMSNGGKETYEVIDPGFYESIGGIAAHYQIDVKKLGLPEAQKAVQNITYNISGPNVRINQNSVDNSTNIVNVNPDISAHIESLKSEIEKLNISKSEKQSALELTNAIEDQFKSGNPSKSVVKTLISALPYAANIASIGSLLLSYIV